MLIKNVRCKRVYQVILSYNIPGIANLVNSEKCQKNGRKDRKVRRDDNWLEVLQVTFVSDRNIL